MSENHEVQGRRRRSREEIKRLVIEYEGGGARVSDFCRKHDLKPSVLQRQLKMRRLSKVNPREAKRLVPVALVEANGNGKISSGYALEVVLSSGRRIGVRPDFDLGTLEVKSRGTGRHESSFAQSKIAPKTPSSPDDTGAGDVASKRSNSKRRSK